MPELDNEQLLLLIQQNGEEIRELKERLDEVQYCRTLSQEFGGPKKEWVEPKYCQTPGCTKHAPYTHPLCKRCKSKKNGTYWEVVPHYSGLCYQIKKQGEGLPIIYKVTNTSYSTKRKKTSFSESPNIVDAMIYHVEKRDDSKWEIDLDERKRIQASVQKSTQLPKHVRS